MEIHSTETQLFFIILSAVILRVSNRDQYLLNCTRCSVNNSREAAPSLRALFMTHRVSKQAKEGKEES